MSTQSITTSFPDGQQSYAFPSPELETQAAAAWLDDLHPGWAAKIDVGRLEMFSQELCIAGQLNLNWEELSDQFAAHIGYSQPVCAEIQAFAAWQHLWIKEIQLRRN